MKPHMFRSGTVNPSRVFSLQGVVALGVEMLVGDVDLVGPAHFSSSIPFEFQMFRAVEDHPRLYRDLLVGRDPQVRQPRDGGLDRDLQVQLGEGMPMHRCGPMPQCMLLRISDGSRSMSNSCGQVNVGVVVRRLHESEDVRPRLDLLAAELAVLVHPLHEAARGVSAGGGLLDDRRHQREVVSHPVEDLGAPAEAVKRGRRCRPRLLEAGDDQLTDDPEDLAIGELLLALLLDQDQPGDEVVAGVLRRARSPPRCRR